MDKPKASVFMGHSYRLEWGPDLKAEDGDKAFGITDHERSVIKLDSGMNPERERETMLHEVIHQMLTHSALGLREKQEEKLAEFFGNAIAHHLMVNKPFWRYLMQGKKK
jgi:Zn-dependent peptidase ImmA (M78 family)